MKALRLLLLLCAMPVHQGAEAGAAPLAEIGEMGRDGCIRSASAEAMGGAAYIEVCISESASEALLSYRRPGGPAVIFDRQPRTESGMSAYLATTRGRQWLLVESQDKTPGSAWALWDLNYGVKIMYGHSSNIPYIRDLDADGLAELVVFDDLLITPTTRWQDEAFGLPRVYRLADTLESRSLRDYPAVVREFIVQAEIAIEAFTKPCADLPSVDQQKDENCREMAGYAASASKARDFAVLFLTGRPPLR